MEITKIQASLRNATGKGPAARLRREGKIPAVAYGKALPSVALAISPKALLSTLKSPHGKNSVIELEIEGQPTLTVLVQDYSYHPVTRELTHVDFLQIALDREVDVEVPFSTHGKAAGITAGGTLRVIHRTLPIRCLPEKIPVKIDHDITHLNVNEVVKTSHLKLPEGVSVRLPPEQTIAAIIAPEKEKAAEGEAAAAPATPAAKKDDKKAAPPAKAPAAPAAKKK
ncbi:MAG: 50S ribosomal protein L25 [Myxococcales bacterium]|nr:50S ribosomal protein L25 [Polyangiaceae bacterium]MDW8251151.1 50S ribosomal protein L25 [Myxococcales bacterium]